MSDFYPGQEVVCVDDGEWLPVQLRELRPEIGHHYIVRDLTETSRGPGCLLVELVNKPRPCWVPTKCRSEVIEPGYALWRFRPVRRESIEQFRQMCVAASNGKTLVKVD